MAFDRELEADVLSECLKNEDFLRKAVPILHRHHFGTKQHAWIWNVLQEVYSLGREIASARIFNVRIERDWKTAEEQDYAAEVLLEIYERRPKAPRAALEEIRRFVRMNAAREGAATVLDKLDDGDVDGAEEAIQTAERTGRQARSLRELRSYGSWASEREKVYSGEAPRGVIPTPLPTLTKHIGGGLPTGRLGFTVALSGTGKSAWSVALGYQAIAAGAVVVHITTEEAEVELGARYDGRLSGLEKAKLMGGHLTPEERELLRGLLKRREADLGSKLFLQELPPTSEVGLVRSLVEQVRSEFPEIPLLLVVDSLDDLRSGTRVENFRLDAIATCVYLKNLSLDLSLAPICVWGVTQAPRNFVGKRLTLAAASETFAKPQKSDVYMAMEDGDSTVAPGKRALEFTILKNRLGGAKDYRIYVEADMGTCQFTERAGCQLRSDGKVAEDDD